MSSLVQAKSAVADSCDLTQYTIVKGGTSCVFGTCQGAVNWPALVTDFLLINLIVSSRYSAVCAINFDRQDLTSAVNSLVSAWHKQRPQQVNNSAKLKVIDGNPYILGDGAGVAGREHNALDRLVQEVALLASNFGGNDVSNNMVNSKNCAVVIYSISELILSVGFRTARDFLRKLTTVIQEASASSLSKTEGAAPTPAAAAVTPCILLVVNESLHGPAVLAQIQSLASVVVRVVPNNGTLSDTVSCEVQTVRRYIVVNQTPYAYVINFYSVQPDVKCILFHIYHYVRKTYNLILFCRSATTGKISESVEMFSCREALLCPLKPVASYVGADDNEEATDSAKLSKTDTRTALPVPAADSASGSSGSNAGVSKGKPGNAKETPQQQQQQHHNQRLITFDSTDPEFDEDSDPDADLDL